MISVGLTGGVAAGKSTAARLMAERGATVISADEIAAEITAPGGLVHRKLVEHFGPEIVKGDNLDKEKLAKIVFQDEAERRFLNQLTHPPIIAAVKEKLAGFSAKAGIVVVEAPLLVEAGMVGMFDKIVVIAARPEEQISRLAERGLSTAEAVSRLRAQANESERFQHADYIILNKSTPADLEAQVEALMRKLGDAEE